MLDNEMNAPGYYGIEVSGWGLDNSFFLEQTDLLWSQDGTKKIALRRAVSEGAIVFVRLVNTESSRACLPVTYQVDRVESMGPNGLCEMRLTQLHPRSKESIGSFAASKLQDETEGVSEGKKGFNELQEILQ
jgi:hypothetical protein